MKDISFLKEHGADIEQSLELFGDVETYNETLKEFKNGIDKKIEEIDKYFKEEDMPNYAIFVHSLKSDCKYFGFMELAEIAYNHEMESKANNVKYVREHYEELTRETQKIKNLILEYFNEFQAPVEPTLETITDDNIILVADDSEVVRIFVKKIFSDTYEIASATNGNEAINIIREHENDNLIKAILLDLNMPLTDGFEVLEYLTKHNLIEKMPVTIISGDSSSESINKAFKYGIVDMINKPFSEAKIKDAVLKTINYKSN